MNQEQGWIYSYRDALLSWLGEVRGPEVPELPENAKFGDAFKTSFKTKTGI